MIEFHYETEFLIADLKHYTDWINRIIVSENGWCKQLDFVFCTDGYLLDINQKYLNHDSLTDIISFDYTEGSDIAGEIYISIDRVQENAVTFKVSMENELMRVMAHGVLHLLGFQDKTAEERKVMRSKEEEKLNMFHVEQ